MALSVQTHKMAKISGKKSARTVAWMDMGVALLGLTAAGICMIQGLAGSWVVKEENAATKNGVHLQMYLSYPVIFFWFGFVPLLFVSSMKLLAAVNLLLATKTVADPRRALMRTDFWWILSFVSLLLAVFLSILSIPLLMDAPVIIFVQKHGCLMCFFALVLVSQVLFIAVVGIYSWNLEQVVLSLPPNAVRVPKTNLLVGITVKK